MTGGGARTQKNKAHKSRFGAKSQRSLHKVAKASDGGAAGAARGGAKGKGKGHGAVAKAERLNRNKLLRDSKRASVLAAKRALSASFTPPRVVSAGAQAAAGQGMEVEGGDAEAIRGRAQGIGGVRLVALPKLRARFAVVPCPPGDLLRCLELIKIADVVIFASTIAPIDPLPPSTPSALSTSSLHTHTTSHSHTHSLRTTTTNKSSSSSSPSAAAYIDDWGRSALSVARAQGLPLQVALASSLSSPASSSPAFAAASLAPSSSSASALFGASMGSLIQQQQGQGGQQKAGGADGKRHGEHRKAALALLGGEFPKGTCHVFAVDSLAEMAPVVRHIAEHRPVTPGWRTHRPYLVAHNFDFIPGAGDAGSAAAAKSATCGTLRVVGYVRGHGINVNQLVHITGVGDFQLAQIDQVPDPCAAGEHGRPGGRGELRDPLVVLNTPDPLAGEQAAWLAAGQEEESEGEEEDEEEGEEGEEAMEEGEERYEDGGEQGGAEEEEEEGSGSDWEEVDEDEGVGGERLEGGSTHDGLMFPDEVDTPDDIPARQRFAKYRGLKSFRSSPWDPKGSLPPEYARIFSFDNWKRTHKAAEERAAAVDRGEVPGSVGAGTFVRLHIMNVPCSEAERLKHEAANRGLPLVVTGLLQHETRMTVLHFSVKKADAFAAPIKSKQRLLFHCGFRRFYTRPTFSTDDINLDKHKFERFLHPGRFAVASIFAPTLFPPLPLLVFADPSAANQHAGEGVGAGIVGGGSVVGGSVVGEGEELQLAATGALRGPDPDRIILKKIVLSG
ncbi:unnamed protein product [Closterium sp. Yama58-4]|nr:unnamed protein product [Closterium sp. Yama58-4]